MSEATAMYGRSRATLHLVSVPGRITCDGRTRNARGAPLSLLWRDEHGQLARLVVEEETINVGAHPSNTVLIEDAMASGFHCRLFRRPDGRVWLRDLGSTNGTYVDGMRVSEAEVQPGATVRIGKATVRLERDDGRTPQKPLPGLLAHDPVVQPMLELLQRAAPSRITILLLGESGSGKEVAARAVHELSPRRLQPFVAINCGAISAELAEAELFGHEKGAFTGAIGSSPGAFGAADGGTLFLDEIGDLPLSLQVKMLRALESHEIKPVGAARARAVDVRILCATHRDLRARVREGTFREDLYYRLAGLTVELPPLRARPLDILPLAEHFLADLHDGVHEGFSADARAALLQHRWPGNVRELRHIVRAAAILTDGPIIRAENLRFEAPDIAAIPARVPEPLMLAEPIGTGPASTAGVDWVNLRGRTLEEVEALAIRASYQRHAGNRRAMMKELGLSKSSLLRKLDSLGLRGGAGTEGEGEGEEG